MSDDSDRLNKAKKLALVGAVAPSLRRQSDSALRRRVARVDINGNIVGYTTLAEVQQQLLKKHALEIEVVEDVRPTELICEFCGKPVKQNKRGKLVLSCKGGCTGQKCCAEPGCEAKPSRHAFFTCHVRKRGGLPWKCKKHSSAWAKSSENSIRVKKMWASMTPERRSEIAKERNSNMTPERRSEIARKRHEKASEGMTKEDMAERMRKVRSGSK